jgi:hypothetical protein
MDTGLTIEWQGVGLTFNLEAENEILPRICPGTCGLPLGPTPE